MRDQSPNGAASILSLVRERDVGVVFQPIVDLNDGAVIAYEALVRPGRNSGFSDAGKLFSQAAHEGLLWELEQVTRNAAISAAADWPRDVKLFLNCAPVVFADERFASAIRDDLVVAPGLAPERVVLEITELSDDQHVEGLLEQVQRVKALGFMVAIDDAGAGASGLNRMVSLRPQWIKLDREFVRAIHEDPLRQNMVKFFVHFARLSGVNVVAEGIETDKELASVISLGVRFGQGYFLARPGTRDETMDETFVASIHERWAAVEATVAADPASAELARLCKPALQLPCETPTLEAARALFREPESVGVLAMDGRRVMGWAGRARVLEHFTGPSSCNAVASLCSASFCQLPPEATFVEALQLACMLDDDGVSDPIILSSGSEIRGIVRLRDLLRAAAFEGRLGQSWRAPVTGLPARVRADQHLAEQIRSASGSGEGSECDHADAAFIDIRGFADYNSAFGYELGDRLICKLRDLITECVVSAVPRTFQAHLGEDRFLLTAAGGQLDAPLARVLARFDEGSVDPLTPIPGLARGRDAVAGLPCARMFIRVLLLPGVFKAVSRPSDVYRIERRLRERARTQEREPGSERSMLVRDVRARQERDRLAA